MTIVRPKSNLGLLSALFLLVTLAGACGRIPLYTPGTDVFLRPVYDLSVDVRADFLNTAEGREAAARLIVPMPSELKVCFFDCNTHELLGEDLIPSGGGFVRAPQGLSDIIIFGLGSESLTVGGSTLRAGVSASAIPTGETLAMSSAITGGKVEFPAVFEPDHLVAGRVRSAVIPVRPESGETTVIDVPASTAVNTYTLEINNIYGAREIRKAEAFITGQARSETLWDLAPGPSPAAIHIDLPAAVPEITHGAGEPVEDRGSIRTVFNTLGAFPETGIRLLLVFETSRGNFVSRAFDVTSQFTNPDNLAHRIIVDEALELPSTSTDGGGFYPEVHGWDEETTVVPL